MVLRPPERKNSARKTCQQSMLDDGSKEFTAHDQGSAIVAGTRANASRIEARPKPQRAICYCVPQLVHETRAGDSRWRSSVYDGRT